MPNPDTQRVWTLKDFAKDTVKIQNKQYVPIGPKLVILREHYPDASITTEVLTSYTDETRVTIRASIVAGARHATAHGTADATGDRALSDSLFELAETRALARALRFFGIGVDATGAEEVQHRRRIAEERADEDTPPVGEASAPTKEQITRLKTLIATAKTKGAVVNDLNPPQTHQQAVELIATLESRLKA